MDSKICGQACGLFPVDNTKPDKGLPERRYEFMPKSVKYYHDTKPINIDDVQDVLRLGTNFSGTENYMDAVPRNILTNKILNPSLADTFWGAANDDQRKLTTELREADQKRANRNARQPGL